MLRAAGHPFSPDGGLRILRGNLGHAVIKTSAVKPEHQLIEAPAESSAPKKISSPNSKQDPDLRPRRGDPGPGPRANGMPELHKLTPALGVLQDRGHRVALVTDGRMSGASGKVPAAIHVTPEAPPAARSPASATAT